MDRTHCMRIRLAYWFAMLVKALMVFLKSFSLKNAAKVLYEEPSQNSITGSAFQYVLYHPVSWKLSSLTVACFVSVLLKYMPKLLSIPLA